MVHTLGLHERNRNLGLQTNLLKQTIALVAMPLRGRSPQKWPSSISIYFKTGLFSEIKRVKELNDLVKVLLEPNQKSNELSMNRVLLQMTEEHLRTF